MVFPRRFSLLVGGIAIGLFLGGFSLPAATLPAGFTETQYGSNLTTGSPTAMAFSPDGRLFICLQGGELRIISNGILLATPFVTVTTTSAGERGLLGVTFDPNFGSTTSSTFTTRSRRRRSTIVSVVSPRMAISRFPEARRLFSNWII